MEWYRQVQFVAAVPMPQAMADEFGTTVNGMWASPEFGERDEVADRHRRGERVLFSVPLIALVPRVYEDPATANLLDEVCHDVGGRDSECGWYYWERKPVYAVCIYSDAFRRYLLDRCTVGVDQGMDVVNLDEIMTSVGLMNRDARGTGFCARCLERFRSHVRRTDPELAGVDDEALRDRLWRDDHLYAQYRRFHEGEAFRVMTGFIAELRAIADARSPEFAISANVAYIGSMIATFGALWGASWGPHLDFLLMENDYRVHQGEPHVLLPRGKFGPWYKLGGSFKGTPTWICPSINVPKQLAGEDHRRYYELMFWEAYANGGRWGYYWWPGVDEETRRQATAPEALKEHIRFIDAHRDLYEPDPSINELAVVYLDGPVMRRPETHQKYVALAQALGELGYQFDVVYGGDGAFNPDDLDLEVLQRYRAILVPEARDLGPAPVAALDAYARRGGDLVVYSESPLDPAGVRQENGQILADFWERYRDEDRERIDATVAGYGTSRIRTSDPFVSAIRSVSGDRQVLHLLNSAYDPETDVVTTSRDLRVRVSWRRDRASCTHVGPDGDHLLPVQVERDELVFELPALDLYALIVLESAGA
jgi:hypothetical protein